MHSIGERERGREGGRGREGERERGRGREGEEREREREREGGRESKGGGGGVETGRDSISRQSIHRKGNAQLQHQTVDFGCLTPPNR